jgi:hypothetical protein
MAAPVAPSRTTDVLDSDAALGAGALAALLLALGIGGGAWMAARSRRKRRWLAYQSTHEPVAAAEPRRPLAATIAPSGDLTPAVPLPAFATVDAVVDATTDDTAVTARGADHAEAARTAAPAPTFDGAFPQTRAERDALLDQMASAVPNEANPFTSRKARMRRAKLILQAREYEDRDNAGQPFDWRTYKPTARHPAPATPEPVTV